METLLLVSTCVLLAAAVMLLSLNKNSLAARVRRRASRH